MQSTSPLSSTPDDWRGCGPPALSVISCLQDPCKGSLKWPRRPLPCPPRHVLVPSGHYAMRRQAAVGGPPLAYPPRAWPILPMMTVHWTRRDTALQWLAASETCVAEVVVAMRKWRAARGGLASRLLAWPAQQGAWLSAAVGVAGAQRALFAALRSGWRGWGGGVEGSIVFTGRKGPPPQTRRRSVSALGPDRAGRRTAAWRRRRSSSARAAAGGVGVNVSLSPAAAAALRRRQAPGPSGFTAADPRGGGWGGGGGGGGW